MSTSGTPPAPPNYTDLAKQTADSQAAATQKQTVANRPNQTDQYGNTSSWTQDPTTGQWTQKVALGGSNQGFLDAQNQQRDTLLGQAGTATANPLDMSGLQTVQDPNTLGGGGFNMDPTGNSQAIQDATYKLLQPDRERERQSEIQRMKNQGLTENSAAYQRGMERLDAGDTNAQIKALLAGQSEYGNAFGRGLNANNQNFSQKSQQQTLAQALRSSQLGERLTQRGLPMSELTKLLQTQSYADPKFGQFMGAGNPGGTDFLNSGQQQYNASMGGFNANEASKASNISGLASLFGDFLGSDSGGQAMDWFKGLFSGGG